MYDFIFYAGNQYALAVAYSQILSGGGGKG